jgi:hypothetical protein
MAPQSQKRTKTPQKWTEWRIDARVQNAILRLVTDNPALSRPAIVRAVLDDPTLGDDVKPSARTLQRYIDEQRSGPDTSGAWQFGDPSITNQALILDTLAELVTWTEGQTQLITTAEAEMLIELAPHTPGLSIRHRWRLAMLYRLRRARGAPTLDLDQFLAFKPWLDETHRTRYERAIALQHVPSSPRMLYEDLTPGMRYGDLEQLSSADQEGLSYADLEGDVASSFC